MAKRRGKPTKLTPKTVEAICEGIEMGMDYKHAAMRARVSYSSFNSWMQQGRAVREAIEEAGEKGVEVSTADKRYLNFLEAVEEANAEAMAYHLDNLESHSRAQPQVSQWLLERRFPETFGPPVVRKELSGRGGQPIQTEDVSAPFTAEERANRLRELLALAEAREETADDEFDD
jgi:hypothetical protein